MKHALLMAVDLGTSFIKTGIYDLKGNCIALSQEAVKDSRLSPGVFIQKGDELFDSVIRCMKKASDAIIHEAGQVEAVAFTGQMAGFMGVDQEWNDVTGWSCSLDTRYVGYARKQLEVYQDKFLNIAGTNTPLMAPKIAWFSHEFPEEAKRIRKYLMISSYVIGKLGGMPIEEAVIDASFITWTGLSDIRRKQWSEEICGDLGIDMGYLPKIVRANEICGNLTEEMARATGLPAGIPLVAGAGDKVAGCVGAGVLGKGDMIFEASSYAGFSCMVEDYIPNHQKNYYDAVPTAFGDGIYAHHYIPGSGITLDWFVHKFMENGSFEEMDKKAALISVGSDGLKAVGLLSGSEMPFDKDLKGVWTGFDWSHKKEHFYRALLESFCYDLALTLDSLKEKYQGYKWEHIKLIGGGAKSCLWPQMLADVTGIRFEKLDREDIALWGASILAGHAVGLIADIPDTARQHIHVKETFEPTWQIHREYKKYKEEYSLLLKYCSDYTKKAK